MVKDPKYVRRQVQENINTMRIVFKIKRNYSHQLTNNYPLLKRKRRHSYDLNMQT